MSASGSCPAILFKYFGIPKRLQPGLGYQYLIIVELYSYGMALVILPVLLFYSSDPHHCSDKKPGDGGTCAAGALRPWSNHRRTRTRRHVLNRVALLRGLVLSLAELDR